MNRFSWRRKDVEIVEKIKHNVLAMLKLWAKKQGPGDYNSGLMPNLFPDKDKHAIPKLSVEQLNSGVIVSVDLDDLTSLQGTVKIDHVEDFIDNPNIKGKTDDIGVKRDFPIVVQYRGKKYVYDGNHRLAAWKMLGNKKANVRLVNLDS